MIKNAKVAGKQVDPDEYRATGIKRGDPTRPMSRSDLMLFAANPARWLAGYQPKDTDATDFGSLIDCHILDRKRFDTKYVVRPETYYNEKDGKDKKWTMNATACKDWVAENVAAGQIVMSPEEGGEAAFVEIQLRKDAAAAFVFGNHLDTYFVPDYQVHVTAEYHDRPTGLVIPIQCLIDIVPHKDHPLFGKSLGDYKTARNAAPGPWPKVVDERSYDAQAAMNLDLYVAATGEDRCEFRHVIQENVYPFQPARRLIASDFIDLGRIKYRTAIALYAGCLKADYWPSWDDMSESHIGGWTLTKPLPYMVTRNQERQWAMAEPETPEKPADDVPH